MHRLCREHFSHHRLQRKPLVSDTSMHHSTCVTHVHVGIANPWWRGKRSRHSLLMRNPQFYVSVKRPIGTVPTVAAYYGSHTVKINALEKRVVMLIRKKNVFHIFSQIFIFKTCHLCLDTGSNVYVGELLIGHRASISFLSFNIIQAVVSFQHVKKVFADRCFH